MSKEKAYQAQQFSCAVDVTLSVIGGKWKLLIYYHLREGITRFGQLKRAIPRITQTMLTQQLRELEEDGIITRTIYPEIPPRVEYQVTEFGRSLECVIAVMGQWGEQYKEMVTAAMQARENAFGGVRERLRRRGKAGNCVDESCNDSCTDTGELEEVNANDTAGTVVPA